MANTTPNLNFKNTQPTLTDLLNYHKKDIMLSLNCHAVGTIQSFDESAQTVTATINYKQSRLSTGVNGVPTVVLYDYPILLDVPIVSLRGGDSYMTFPISVGDECLILFNDRDIDNWFQSGQVTGVATGRLHSFSDGFALVGVRSSNNVITGYETDYAILGNGDTKLGVGTTKVAIENSDYSLNDLLQELVNDIKSLVTATAAITVTCAAPGSPSTPPINAAAINAVTSTLTATAVKIGNLIR